MQLTDAEVSSASGLGGSNYPAWSEAGQPFWLSHCHFSLLSPSEDPHHQKAAKSPASPHQTAAEAPASWAW